MDAYSDCLTLARAELIQADRMIGENIRNYPTPISGCDAAFNGLLADREKVHRALLALSSDVFVPTPRTPMPDSGVESR
ncbi:hypothetical protein [Gymnodinialimonas hymeniacidonis]|uniref:hypothetical protein n=1 Tax=Gymnodinialimonas hymeniacidonis TaxID=3126508 RepID=UPI0034C5CA21